MLILRQLTPVLRKSPFIELKRFCGHSSLPQVRGGDSGKNKMKLVHEETLKYISPNPSITVKSDISIKVHSADVHEYPNGDVFIAQLQGGPAKNCHASLKVNVSEDDKNVEVIVKKLTDAATDFHCELAVPIRASLDIKSRNGASVRHMYCDALKVKAEKFISVADIKADTIELTTVSGNIVSSGNLLGRKMQIRSKEVGHIFLDKIHGDQLSCKTNKGNITTKCSYVEASKFETNNGSLDLQNIHKSTEVYVHSEGNLKMTGVHGNIKVNFNGDSLDLQLSELSGENFIQVDNAKSSLINISEDIESNTNIIANAVETDAIINLDTTLQHLTVGLHENKQQFKWPLEETHANKLHINIKDSLTLGKSSWMESLRLRMDQNTNQK